MKKDKVAAEIIEKQLAGFSDADLGQLFRSLLIKDHGLFGVYCRFKYKKPPESGYDFSKPPTFDIYSHGCGCCSSDLTREHDSIVDAFLELNGATDKELYRND